VSTIELQSSNGQGAAVHGGELQGAVVEKSCSEAGGGEELQWGSDDEMQGGVKSVQEAAAVTWRAGDS